MNLFVWYKVSCPHCRKPNWIDGGDPQDMTHESLVGFTCWKCERSFTWDGEPADNDGGFWDCGQGQKRPE